MKNTSLFPYFFLLAVQLLFNPSVAQGQGWVRFATPDILPGRVADIVSHPDGGVLVAYTENPQSNTDRHAKLAHFDANGALVWERTVLPLGSMEDVVIGDDGFPTVLGYDMTATRVVLSHYDWQGNSLGSQQEDFFYSSAQLAAFPGGGFVSDLNHKPGIGAPIKLALQRFDANGSLLWRADIDSLPAVGLPVLSNKGLAVNSLGQSILGYKTGLITAPEYHLTVIDANGDSLWYRSDLFPITVGGLSDDNFFYVVTQNTPTFNYVLRKINPAGALIWERAVDFSGLFIAEGKYIATPGGGLVLGGTGIGVNGKTIVLQVFDNQGNLLKKINRALPGYAENDLTVSAISQAPNGGFYVSGIVNVGNGVGRTFLVKMDANGNIYPQRIWGNMTYDENQNCLVDAGELGLEGHKIKIEDLTNGHTFYASSDSLGQYFVEGDSTEFLVSPLLLNPYWESCQSDTLIQLGNSPDSVQVDFPLKKVVECAFLEVDISALGLRRCFDNTYYVRYCNTGTATAENAYVEVQLDPFLSFLSSSIPGVDLGNQRWRFPVGNVAYGDCDAFSMLVHLDCDSTVLGQTHCVEAHIYPDSFCLQNGPWSGANVEVNGLCNPDSVDLVIKNTGTAPNSAPLDYVIIEDNIIFFQGTSSCLPATR